MIKRKDMILRYCLTKAKIKTVVVYLIGDQTLSWAVQNNITGRL